MPHKRPGCDVELDLYFLQSDDNGKRSPAFDGYRPQFFFAYEHWAVEFMFPDSASALPGQRVRATARFASPELLAGRLTVGAPFLVREGAQIVAYGSVSRIADLASTVPLSSSSAT